MGFDTSRYAENERRKTLARNFKALNQHLREALLVVIEHMGNRSDIFKTCVTCEHWDDKQEICKKFGARPPAKIIVDGCEQYKDFDEIPF